MDTDLFGTSLDSTMANHLFMQISSKSIQHTPYLLLVEDSETTIELIMEILKILSFDGKIESVCSGLDLLSWLENNQDMLPGMIVLELNLSDYDGFDILRELNQNPLLRSIPVIVFSGSVNPEDERKSLELGASQYVHKPLEFEKFQANLELITTYWKELYSYR